MSDLQAANNDKPNGGMFRFVGEARREIAKVTWPTRREVGMTTTLIVVFALIAGVFFMGIDAALGVVVSRLLGMNG